MSTEPYRELLRAANDNCDNLAVSRAQAMAQVRSLCIALKWEGERSARGLLGATKALIADAESWIGDPIGIERPRLPAGYEISLAGDGVATWTAPGGHSACESTEAVAAIRCWEHWAESHHDRNGKDPQP